MRGGRDLVGVFLRWIWWRAVLHNGWWLVTSVYLVVDADLSRSQLVLIGVAQGVTALVFEVPGGVVSDTISRKWSLVASHVLHSFLAQAEYLGEIACGLAVALIARLAGLSPALVACGALFATTILLIQRLGARRAATASPGASEYALQRMKPPR